MLSEVKLEVPQEVLEWERKVKQEKRVKLILQKEAEQIKSAAARDFLEALQEDQILDEIEIKQEIVLDSNE
jgi:hypothetical protein